MATNIIKLNNGLTGDSAVTYVPVTVASAVQYSYTGGVMSVQQALGTVAQAVIDNTVPVLETLNTHITDTASLSYSSSNGVYIAGVHGSNSGVKINAGTGINITNSGNTLTVNATHDHASGSDNQHLGASATGNVGTISLDGNGGNVKISNNGASSAGDKNAHVEISYSSTNGIQLKVTYTDTNTSMSLNKSYTSGIKVASYILQDSSTTDYIYVPVGTTSQHGVLKLGTASGTAAAGDHKHTLTISNAPDYTPTSDTVAVISYVSKPTANASSWTITYTRANVPTTDYISNNYVTKTDFNTFTASGMMYKGDASALPTSGLKNGYLYHLTAAVSSIGAENGDFVVAYNVNEAGTSASWSVWDKNVDGAMYYGNNTLTSGNIVVADGTVGKVKTQTIAELGLATSSDITNMVTSTNALAANAIVLGNGNKTVTTTTSYYPTKSTTAWANSDTKIPTELAVGKYISAQSYLTAQDHTGKGTANRLAWWTSATYHTAYTGNWGSSTKFAYIESGVLKEGTLPEGNKEGKNIVGASATATADAAVSTNGSVYLNHIENGSPTSHHKITGASGINVTATDTGTTIKIEHSTAAGYKHIPTGGAANQVLKYGNSSGTASWDSLKEGLKYEIYGPTDDFTLDLGESTGSVSLAKTTF